MHGNAFPWKEILMPVPLPEAVGKVLYVWLDAPIGYISATKAWADEKGVDWRPYWTSPDTKLVHFLAKDNIVFHCIIFPILLREHGDFILPNNVPANEFLNLEGNKISTSRNWAVWLHEYMADFQGRSDELRYVLNSIAPEFRDSEFTWADFQARVNNELVGNLGNFINRVVVLTHKLCGGEVPNAGDLQFAGISAEVSNAFQSILASQSNISQSIETFRFREAQSEIMKLSSLGNLILSEEEPWKRFAESPERVRAVMNVCLQIAGNLGLMLAPFLPKTSQRIKTLFGITEDRWDSISPELLPAGRRISSPEHLFKRIEDGEIEAQVMKLKQSLTTAVRTPPMPQKDSIAFDDFMKADIRVATITAAERVPKTDKLMKLTLDTGLDTRTVVSGIAEHFTAEELPGRQVSLLLNLEPRKIKGIESQGMVLMAEDETGRLHFVSPSSSIGAGAIVK